jgi:hypothetical protein
MQTGMNKKIKVLVFPCGSENASEIHQSLRYSLHVELVGASSVEDYGRFRFKRYVGGLPNIRDREFDQAFADLIARLKIDLVFATHDSVLEYLAPKASQMGFFLVNGDLDAAATARQKSVTYRLFQECPWVPKTFASAEQVDEWPIVVKPDRGQGGQAVALATGFDDAARLAVSVRDPVFVEYLPGEELTVDCFSDRKRTLLWVGPRTRERVRAGITMRSQLQPLTPEIDAIAKTINARLNLRGPWFFQIKGDTEGRWKLLEISCRVGGAMVAQRAQGINFPLMAVHDYLGRDLATLPNRHIRLIERCIATRAQLDFEYDNVFVDLDDTLIIDGHPNPIALAFLYQSASDGKQITLLTRHALDVTHTLRSARIAPELFDKIVRLGPDDAKADYVTAKSIFIDNHFPERAGVASACGVPVLDVDALEFFIR